MLILLAIWYSVSQRYRPIATHECCGRSVGLCVCVCVCLLVTFVNYAKTAEVIEMPFGSWVGWVHGNMY